MKYAVVQSGGKQYRISEGDKIQIDRLKITPQKEIKFDKVLLFVPEKDSDEVKIGHPFLADVVVKGRVLKERKKEKIKVMKFKSKVRYRRVVGQRQTTLEVLVEKIDLLGK